MRLKSRGLGRKELVMDFREYTVSREGREVVINGTIREPVHWDFSIRMCEDDLPGLVKVAGSRNMIRFLLRAIFKRNRDAHWSLERKEHLEAVKAAIEARKESESSADGEAGKKEAAEKKKGTRAARSERVTGPTKAAQAREEPAEAEPAQAESTEVEVPPAEKTPVTVGSGNGSRAAEPAEAATEKKSVSFARPKAGPEHRRSGAPAGEAAGADGDGSSDESEAAVSTGASEGNAP